MPRPTYPQYNAACGWNAMLAPRPPRPSLSGSHRADYAVVGAGYTGLAAARRLHELQPQARIVILEASVIGEGSSGRNSGFTNPRVTPSSASPAAVERARHLSKIFAETFEGMVEVAAAQGETADLQQVGALRGAATPRGEAKLRESLVLLKALDLPHIELDRDGIKERTGLDYYRYGYLMRDTWLLQPAKLIRALADGLPEAVSLHEQSPVTRLQRDGSQWRLHCPEGELRAPVVVLATNGYIPSFGYMGTQMATIFTYAAMTEPVPEQDLAHLGQSEAWGLLPAHRLGTTLRRIGRDRLMVRSLYAHKAELRPGLPEQELRARFLRRWPALSHVPFASVWGGTTAFTMNGAPAWGQVDEGLYASGGCNGGGITKGAVLGRALADLICAHPGAEDMSKLLGTASFIAPEPFRSIGFHAVSAYARRQAGAES